MCILLREPDCIFVSRSLQVRFVQELNSSLLVELIKGWDELNLDLAKFLSMGDRKVPFAYLVVEQNP